MVLCKGDYSRVVLRVIEIESLLQMHFDVRLESS